jgi:hypothetical protein
VALRRRRERGGFEGLHRASARQKKQGAGEFERVDGFGSLRDVDGYSDERLGKQRRHRKGQELATLEELTYPLKVASFNKSYKRLSALVMARALNGRFAQGNRR